MRMQQSVKQQAKLKSKCMYNIDNLWPHLQRNQSRNRQPGDDAERRNSNREELIDPLPLMGIHITSIRLASLYLNYCFPSSPFPQLFSLSSPFIVYLKSVLGETRKNLKNSFWNSQWKHADNLRGCLSLWCINLLTGEFAVEVLIGKWRNRILKTLR